jgi:hypothetical protein
MYRGRGEALTGSENLEEEMDKERKHELIDPIMLEEDQIWQIMVTTRRTRNGVPYQYKMNNKKRSVDAREGLASDEEEVEDILAMDQI